MNDQASAARSTPGCAARRRLAAGGGLCARGASVQDGRRAWTKGGLAVDADGDAVDVTGVVCLRGHGRHRYIHSTVVDEGASLGGALPGPLPSSRAAGVGESTMCMHPLHNAPEPVVERANVPGHDAASQSQPLDAAVGAVCSCIPATIKADRPPLACVQPARTCRSKACRCSRSAASACSGPPVRILLLSSSVFTAVPPSLPAALLPARRRSLFPTVAASPDRSCLLAAPTAAPRSCCPTRCFLRETHHNAGVRPSDPVPSLSLAHDAPLRTRTPPHARYSRSILISNTRITLAQPHTSLLARRRQLSGPRPRPRPRRPLRPRPSSNTSHNGARRPSSAHSLRCVSSQPVHLPMRVSTPPRSHCGERLNKDVSTTPTPTPPTLHIGSSRLHSER